MGDIQARLLLPTLESDVPAAVRYGGMLGATDDTARTASARELAPDHTVPLAQTTPPINLTALMEGFELLFAALQPEW